MNLIILAVIITLASAAQLPSRNYIPQGQGGSGGSGGFGGSKGGFGGSQGGFGGSNGGFGGGGGFGGNGQHQGHQNGGSGGSGGYGGNGNGNRPQQSQEQNAAIVKQEQSIDESGSYHFGYETENGIRAEEAGNPSEAQGGFSYKGDDGQTYTVTYTSGEGGFRPQGEHLPVAPPTPDAILEALQKNAQDEAAGIFDDGIYRPDANGGSGGHGNGHFGNGKRPGQGGQPSFGGNGNHQNGFNQNSGYTY